MHARHALSAPGGVKGAFSKDITLFQGSQHFMEKKFPEFSLIFP